MVWNYGSVVFNNAKQITAPKDSLQSYYIKGKNLVYVAMVKEVVTAGAKNSSGCGGKSKYVYIPSSVTSIGQNAFYGCSSLQSITIPSSVTSIGQNAFYNCSLLQSITIPENVTSIGQTAFSNCSSLQSIVIPENVTSIGSSAFQSCSSIYFAEIKSDAKISSNTYNFYGYKCRYDFRYCTSIPILSSSSGLNSNSRVDFIIVPDALYDEWIAATNWVAYASKIKKASEVENTEVTG